MPTKPTAKVIPFPRAKKQEPPPEMDVFAELKAALTEAPSAPKVREPKKARLGPTDAPVVINGNGAQVAARDIHIHTTIHHAEKAPRPTVVVQTGVGVIDAQQKHKLLELRDSVVEASTAGIRQKTPGSVMLALNKHMKVNSYSEILAADFDKAVKYLTRARAIKNSLASASRKLPSWRAGRTRAIHARSKELDIETWRVDYMKLKFGKVSMVDLGDDDLELLYRAVMAKKK